MTNYKGKARLLHILRYLWEETDLQHTVSIADILNYLQSKNITANRHTIVSDIECLSCLGIDIICQRERQNRYSIGERLFELPELKMLIDAVEAARFIPQNKSEAIIRKLISLVSVNDAPGLVRNTYVNKRIKTESSRMYYSVDMLNQAINEHKRVEFQYYSYTPLKEKVLRHNGEYYSVSPHRLTWSNDSYYLLGHSSGRAGENVFRIDRILNLGFAKQPWIPPEEGFCIEEFINSSFLMYEGVFQKVVLQCHVSSMNNVVDKFGFDVETEYDPDTDAEHFIAKVNVCVSPTFYSWVFNYCGKIKILAPEPVVEGFSAMLKMHI